MASKKKSGKPVDLTAEVLAGIRADVRAITEGLAQTAAAIRAEIAQANERLERLERRQTEADMRVATELTAVVGAIGDLKTTLVADIREVKTIAAEIREDGARMNALEARIQRLEAKAS